MHGPGHGGPGGHGGHHGGPGFGGHHHRPPMGGGWHHRPPHHHGGCCGCLLPVIGIMGALVWMLAVIF